MKVKEDYIKNSILGAIVGDAMDVPYEFRNKHQINNSIKDYMIMDTRRGLPSGAWSDDSSMILCTVESLNTTKTNMVDIANNYLKWYDENHWTAIGRIFDMGSTTRTALEGIRQGQYINGCGEMDKGNGSLMRVLPLALYLRNEDINRIKDTVENFSSLTHSTLECKIACVWYALLAKNMIKWECQSIYSILLYTIDDIQYLYSPKEIEPFREVFSTDIFFKNVSQLSGSGYVVDAVGVIINCLFNSDNFRDAILRAILIGDDTDTNASLVGGIAGLAYDIPTSWIDDLMKKDEILELLNSIDWNEK